MILIFQQWSLKSRYISSAFINIKPLSNPQNTTKKSEENTEVYYMQFLLGKKGGLEKECVCQIIGNYYTVNICLFYY